jgi:hypothetical protein
LNPIRISCLGGDAERCGKATHELAAELANARVDASRNHLWSSYRSYVKNTKKPEWLTTAAVLEFLGDWTPRKLPAQYRRELEEAEGLGEWETLEPGVFCGSKSQTRSAWSGSRLAEPFPPRTAMERAPWPSMWLGSIRAARYENWPNWPEAWSIRHDDRYSTPGAAIGVQ